MKSTRRLLIDNAKGINSNFSIFSKLKKKVVKKSKIGMMLP
jgi:hypothetical protein